MNQHNTTLLADGFVFLEGPRWHHIGIYAYRRPALDRFVTLPPSHWLLIPASQVKLRSGRITAVERIGSPEAWPATPAG